jgi:hypothetical protein
MAPALLIPVTKVPNAALGSSSVWNAYNDPAAAGRAMSAFNSPQTANVAQILIVRVGMLSLPRGIDFVETDSQSGVGLRNGIRFEFLRGRVVHVKIVLKKQRNKMHVSALRILYCTGRFHTN